MVSFGGRSHAGALEIHFGERKSCNGRDMAHMSGGGGDRVQVCFQASAFSSHYFDQWHR